jgi:3-dehydroquinate synthase
LKSSKLIYLNKTSELRSLDKSSCLLIYDLVLEKKFKSFLKSWPRRYGVESGESLKDVKHFPQHIIKILTLAEGVSTKNLHIVSFGGGSVGDFSGFVASVFKRGVELSNIPSTWLAAVDSAHGGKTALNVGPYKNQIGTFYPAQNIFLIKEVLLSQPKERDLEARGEVVKMALLNGQSLYKSLNRVSQPISSNEIWQNLPKLIAGKYTIVAQDPYETKNIRYLLNFGHTIGHVLELQLGLAHGVAVAYGLRFAIEFSRDKGILTELKWLEENLVDCNLPTLKELVLKLKKLKNIESLLAQDKKLSQNKKINFIYVKKPGRCFVKETSISELIHFMKVLKIYG